MKQNQLSRRGFMKGAAGAAGAAALGMSGCASIHQGELIREGRKLNFACIGAGGQGGNQVKKFGKTENIVALCDVDWDRAKGSFNAFPKAKKYKDFRKMLCEMGDQIDAVTVSTPDHSHFQAAKMAIEMGKHTFVQKPLTHTVWEARQLTLLARKHNVVTQMGNQGHANEGTRLVREWVQSGFIGPVHEVHIWTNRPVWPQGIGIVDMIHERYEPPETLDWNLWLGSAPWRPYHKDYCPFKWRGWWDWGCGALGDMGCHTMDAAFWALDLGKRPATSIEAISETYNDQTAPAWSTVTYKFPALGDMPPLTLKWFDGKFEDGTQNLPPRSAELESGRKVSKSGQMFFGEKATIMDGTDYCTSPRIIPEDKFQKMLPNRPEKWIRRIPDSDNHREFTDAIKGLGPMPGSSFDYSGPLTEFVNLGNVAIRVGKKIDWDGKNLVARNMRDIAHVSHGYRDF